MAAVLPHLIAILNAVITTLLVLGYRAIRGGDRRLHRRCMLGAFGTGVVFLAVYVTQVVLVGHSRFPGDDWVRTAFLVILGTHTVLAVIVAPAVLVLLGLAVRERFVGHRRLARFVLPAWIYVSVTGIVIYLMNNYVRPAG